MAYKMKGSPMYRNFGIGSPMNKNGDPEEKQYSKKKTLKEASKVSGSKETTTDPKYTKTLKPKTTTYTKEVKPKETTYTKEVKSKPHVPYFGKDMKKLYTKAVEYAPYTQVMSNPIGAITAAAGKLFGSKKSTSKTTKTAAKAAGKAAGKNTK